MMADVLVTGASGFIGTHLTRLLRDLGCQVRCLVRSTSRTEQLESLGVELVHGRVEDPAAVEHAVHGVDWVLHLAGLTCAFRASTLFRVNGVGTACVARACAKQQTPPVLVVCSSIAASGPTRVGHIRREGERPTPVSCYGRSKRAGERACEVYAAEVPTTIVRPGVVFGPANREMLPMFRAIRRLRTHVVPGIQSPPLSYIEVGDLVNLLVVAARYGKRLAAHDAAAANGQGYYFACVPEYPNYYQLGRLLRKFLDRPNAWILHFPEPLPWLMAGASEVVARLQGRPQSFNVDKIREATAESWACSCAAATLDLQFRPSASLADQLQATCDWYRQNNWL